MATLPLLFFACGLAVVCAMPRTPHYPLKDCSFGDCTVDTRGSNTGTINGVTFLASKTERSAILSKEEMTVAEKLPASPSLTVQPSLFNCVNNARDGMGVRPTSADNSAHGRRLRRPKRCTRIIQGSFSGHTQTNGCNVIITGSFDGSIGINGGSATVLGTNSGRFYRV